MNFKPEGPAAVLAPSPDTASLPSPELGLLFEADSPLHLVPLQTRRWLAEQDSGPPGQRQLVLAPLAGLDPLACFEPAAQHPGRLLLLCAVAQHVDETSLVGVPYRPHLLGLAERNGWGLTTEQDVSVPLAAWLRRFRDDKAGAPLLAQADALLAALGGGSVHGLVLVFDRVAQPDQALVRVGPQRSEPMRELFGQVFGHAMTAEHWQWKYGGGRGLGMGIEQDGRLVAHYGGQLRELRVFGRPATGCQMCDVMVASSANRSLVRRGPMQRLTASFLENHLGWGHRSHIGFGFPSDRHNGLADKLRLYTRVDRMVQLSWPAAPAEVVEGQRVQAVELQAGALRRDQQRAIDSLWQAMAEAMRDVALGVRTADWVRWRYLEAPHARYVLRLVRSRWLRRPLGLLVMRERDDALDLVDIVAPPSNLPLLVRLARAQAAAHGRPVLRLWITASQQQRFASIDPQELSVEALSIQIPANAHTPGPDPQLLQGRWFLMAGDADFS